MTIADLKAYIESETGIPSAAQNISYDGHVLQDASKSLQQCQVAEDSMLGMHVRRQQAPSSSSGRIAPAQASRAPQRPGYDEIETTRLRAVGDPIVLENLRSSYPTLADNVSNPTRFHQAWGEIQRQMNEIQAEKQRKLAMLEADPFNIDAQREIEEMIRQEQVTENLQSAMEHNPEGECTYVLNSLAENPLVLMHYSVFGRVHMLYIPVEVNNHKVKAFVDSGAQTTIMSPECAEKCGIYRLLDKRYAGIARGVGTAKILGRVHSAMIKIGEDFLPCSFTVMEGKDVDLLLGLDMLKKHQACIDLQKGKLIIQGNEVEFLGEADIPKHEEVYKEEPTIDGPSGKKIGAISGTVTESGSAESSASATAAAGQTAPPGRQQQPQATTGSASFPKENIEQLTNMGFSKEEAIHALEIAGGNVEVAAGLLL
ncbi:DNA damage-inducible protein 1, partial [Lecanoromycetidae sp. Uapishka_2]